MNKETWELLPFWFPKSQNSRNWAFVFTLLTILSIDWWNWESSNRLGNWIPDWIIYLMIIQFVLAYSVWKFSKVFNPIIIEREFESCSEKQLTKETYETEEKEEEPELKEEETIEDTDDSDKKNITNIYISDSVINRSIIGEKDDKDE